MSYFQRKKYKVLTFLFLGLFLFVCYFSFAIHIMIIEDPGTEQNGFQGSHHGREAAVPLKKCDMLQSSQGIF